jgi:hypothetical protein
VKNRRFNGDSNSVLIKILVNHNRKNKKKQIDDSEKIVDYDVKNNKKI